MGAHDGVQCQDMASLEREIGLTQHVDALEAMGDGAWLEWDGNYPSSSLAWYVPGRVPPAGCVVSLGDIS